jgi:ABC-2 type transport system ATP-binding protein
VANGMTAIVSTAYLDEAERCDRVALLSKGKLAALDAPAELQGRLRGRTIAIDSDAPVRAMEMMRAHRGVRSAALFGQSLHLTLHSEGVESELRELLEHGGIAVRDMHALEPSLEDVFIDLSATENAN